jgi:hypothetical protein
MRRAPPNGLTETAYNLLGRPKKGASQQRSPARIIAAAAKPACGNGKVNAEEIFETALSRQPSTALALQPLRRDIDQPLLVIMAITGLARRRLGKRTVVSRSRRVCVTTFGT